MQLETTSSCCLAITLNTGVPNHFMLCLVLFKTRPGATSVVALITLVKKYLYELYCYGLPVEQDIFTQGHIYHIWWRDHHHGWYENVSIKQVYLNYESQCSQEWTLSVRFLSPSISLIIVVKPVSPGLSSMFLLTPF